MRQYHVAIVGSGPSGFFAAASLLKAADSADHMDVAVDMLEMLPTPWGLVRSGVAPDHPKIKSVSAQFEKTAEDPRFRFFGNIAAAGKITKNNIKVLREYASREHNPQHRRIVLRFFTSPIEIKGDDRVESIVLGRNELVTDAGGRMVAKDTGAREELPVQLVVRSVGYRGVPTPGLPFDDKAGTIPHSEGRIEGSHNEYVAGWIKRGPSGVIGTNKKCSQESVDTLLNDLAAMPDAELDRAGDYGAELAEWLTSRQPALVTAAHWQAIDRFERDAGEPHGRPRAKLANLTELLRIAHG